MAIDPVPGGKAADSYTTVADADAYFAGFVYDGGAWAGFTDAQKEVALKQATARIDALRFTGWKADREQRLQFPRNTSRTVTGSAITATASTVVDVPTLADPEQDFYDSYFAMWGLWITDGTGKFQRRLVTANVKATGTLTVADDFDTVPDTSSGYVLVEEVPEEVRHATAETALWFLQGGDQGQEAGHIAQGVKSFSIGKLSETYGGWNLCTVQGVVLPYTAARMLSLYTNAAGVMQ